MAEIRWEVLATVQIRLDRRQCYVLSASSRSHLFPPCFFAVRPVLSRVQNPSARHMLCL